MEHIKKAITKHYGSQAAFARIIEVDPSTLSRLLAGSYLGDKQALWAKIYAEFDQQKVQLASILTNESYEAVQTQLEPA